MTQTGSHHSLLLLARPPSEVSLNSLRVAYGPSLTRVLTKLAQISADANAPQNDVLLSIAVASDVSSFSSYTELQKFFGLMYRLACVISMGNSIDVQFGNDVDVRMMLINYTSRGQHDSSLFRAGKRFISLEDLTQRRNTWDHVYSVESETGEALLRDFVRLYKSSSLDSALDYPIIRVPGGLTMQMDNAKGVDEDTASPKFWSSHWSVAVGGTFDHLHAGHKLLLTMTALVLAPFCRSDSSEERCLTIGITGDDLLRNKKHVEELEAWEERQRSVKSFLLEFLSYLAPQNILRFSETVTDPQERGREVRDTLHSGLQVRYKEIFDPFGPTITDSKITALVVSSETRAGGKAVNDKRTDKGWQSLEVFEVDVLDADEDGGERSKDSFESKISSTEIRSRLLRRKLSANAKS